MAIEIVADNPVLIRELRRRMRGRGLVTILCVYLAAMCLGALLIIQWNAEQIEAQQFTPGALAVGRAGYKTATDIGRSISSAILILQAILVLAIAPAMTGALVRGEKERLTFDFLRSTAIRPFTYVVGALLSALLYVGLALLCGLPVLMISYLYGGVSDLVEITSGLLVLSLALSSLALMISCSAGPRRKQVTGLGLAAGTCLLAGYAIFGAPFGFSLAMAPQLNASWGGLPLKLLLVGLVCSLVSAVSLTVATRNLFASAPDGG